MRLRFDDLDGDRLKLFDLKLFDFGEAVDGEIRRNGEEDEGGAGALEDE